MTQQKRRKKTMDEKAVVKEEPDLNTGLAVGINQELESDLNTDSAVMIKPEPEFNLNTDSSDVGEVVIESEGREKSSIKQSLSPWMQSEDKPIRNADQEAGIIKKEMKTNTVEGSSCGRASRLSGHGIVSYVVYDEESSAESESDTEYLSAAHNISSSDASDSDADLPADSSNDADLPADSSNDADLPADSSNDADLPADSSNVNELDGEWQRVTGSSSPLQPLFIPQPKMKHCIQRDAQCLYYFECFFSDEIITDIVCETNRYAEHLLSGRNESQVKNISALRQSWKRIGPFTSEEIKANIALALNMGFNIKPKISDYWSRDETDYIPIFSKVTSRDRYQVFLQTLHLVDNEKYPSRRNDDYNPLNKVNEFVDRLNVNFKAAYSLDKHISIDECLIGSKNRMRNIHSIPNKKHLGWGIKEWVMCEAATGYTYTVKLYGGKRHTMQKENESKGFAVLRTLTSSIISKGHHIVTDNFYTTPDLVEYLYANGTVMTGTVSKIRKDLPNELKKKKFKVGDKLCYKKGNTNIIAWRQKSSQRGPLIIATSYTGTGDCEITRASGKKEKVPDAVHVYTQNMRGVDIADQKICNYMAERRCNKWWRKVFWKLVHRSMLNAYILYSHNTSNTPKKTRHQFHKCVIKELICGFTLKTRTHTLPFVCSPLASHKPTPLAERKLRNCVSCSTLQKRKRTRYICNQCDVGLCKLCFHLYNHAGNPKRRK